MTPEKVFEFIAKCRTAIISSVDEEGYPITRAMLSPSLIDGKDIYFSTNTSSNKVKQFLLNPKSCVYVYKRGLFKYQGVTVRGTVEVCQDQSIKNKIWRSGDKLFYKEGVTDPDYCVLKFTGLDAEYYCDFKVEKIKL